MYSTKTKTELSGRCCSSWDNRPRFEAPPAGLVCGRVFYVFFLLIIKSLLKNKLLCVYIYIYISKDLHIYIDIHKYFDTN